MHVPIKAHWVYVILLLFGLISSLSSEVPLNQQGSSSQQFGAATSSSVFMIEADAADSDSTNEAFTTTDKMNPLSSQVSCSARSGRNVCGNGNGNGLVETTNVEAPAISSSQVLSATAHILVKNRHTGTVLSNATGFFVAPDKVLTAAHLLMNIDFHFTEIAVVTNSRNPSGIKEYKVTALYVNQTHTPCQAFLNIAENHTDFLPLSKEAPQDGTQVRIISNSPYGFSGIFLDGIVSRIFDVWRDNIDHQCLRTESLALHKWHCDQERFLISAPTWQGASGSPVFSLSGVVGTVESTGPHHGTTVVASSRELSIPEDSQFIDLTYFTPKSITDGTEKDASFWVSMKDYFTWK